MRKMFNLRKMNAAIAAFATVASLSASSCTTNRTPGAGEPVTSGSSVRTVPTSSLGTGSERPQVPPPMTSSLPSSRADRAAALMSQHASSVRVLGPVAPALSGSEGYWSDRNLVGNETENLVLTHTVNPSINSLGIVPGITSGADPDDVPDIDLGQVNVGTQFDSTALALASRPRVTPTSAGAAVPPLPMLANPPAATSETAPGNSASDESTVATSRSRSSEVVNPVRVVATAGGRVVITNVGKR